MLADVNQGGNGPPVAHAFGIHSLVCVSQAHLGGYRGSWGQAECNSFSSADQVQLRVCAKAWHCRNGVHLTWGDHVVPFTHGTTCNRARCAAQQTSFVNLPSLAPECGPQPSASSACCKAGRFLCECAHPHPPALPPWCRPCRPNAAACDHSSFATARCNPPAPRRSSPMIEQSSP